MLKRRVPLIECVLQIVKHGEPANFIIESYWCRVAKCTEEAFAMIDHDVNVECYRRLPLESTYEPSGGVGWSIHYYI